MATLSRKASHLHFQVKCMVLSGITLAQFSCMGFRLWSYAGIPCMHAMQDQQLLRLLQCQMGGHLPPSKLLGMHPK